MQPAVEHQGGALVMGLALWDVPAICQHECCPPFHPHTPPTTSGSITDISWTEVKVGDALVVRDDELFPADMVCLQSQLPDRVCFIRTTNLDGETNLKIRKPIDLKGIQVGGCLVVEDVVPSGLDVACLIGKLRLIPSGRDEASGAFSRGAWWVQLGPVWCSSQRAALKVPSG